MTQLLRYRALSVGDELRFDTVTRRQRLRIVYIAQGGRIYLHNLDRASTNPSPLNQSDGTPYFTAPEQIIGAFRNIGQPVAGGLTSWNALEVFRGGNRVGTLDEIREDFRVRGSQQTRPRNAASAPAPAIGAGDTTGPAGDGAAAAEEAEEEEMDVASDSSGDTIPYADDDA